MLELKKVTKDYPAGEDVVHALKGVDMTFRKSEFVSILGPSGCGKTTLLNIIGGLDGYTEGDLVINGKSTKEYRDRDWDSYRNHSVGFVFQSYNLIPHQSVLQNVEIALTLSGIAKAERRERAVKALEAVGLGNQINKKPNQMSGGQMQRVAIARALVNNPDIILADEPTGALDTETSVQVMEILKEVARDRLVVMVTHNPDLAEKYSSRIIRMLDGEVTDDSAPLSESEYAEELASVTAKEEATEPTETAEVTEENADNKKPKKAKGEKKPSMSFWTAFRLSLTNLFTKKGRTILTAFAGSIGIIGIALILAVSQGMTGYIDTVQEETLSTYPITVRSEETDMTSLMKTFMDMDEVKPDHGNDAVYKRPLVFDLAKSIASLETSKNDLNAFKKYLESEIVKEDTKLSEAVIGIHCSYGLNLVTYTKTPDDKIMQCDSGVLMRQLVAKYLGANGSLTSSTAMIGGTLVGMGNSLNLWEELLPAKDGSSQINEVLRRQYDVVYGSWPTEWNEIVLVLDKYNQLDDITLYVLGFIGDDVISDIVNSVVNKTPLESKEEKWSYEEICGKEIKVALNSDCYDYNEFTGTCTDKRDSDAGLQLLYDGAMKLKVAGIIKPNANTSSTMLSGTIGYTSALTKHVVDEASKSKVIEKQMENPLVDIITGKPFSAAATNLSESEKVEKFNEYAQSLRTPRAKAELFDKVFCYTTDAEVQTQFDQMLDGMLEGEGGIDKLKATIGQVLRDNGLSDELIESQLKQLDDMVELGLTTAEIRARIVPFIEADAKVMIREQNETAKLAYFDSVIAPQSGLDKDDPDYETKKTALKADMLTDYIGTQPAATVAEYYNSLMDFSESTYEQNLLKMGYVDFDTPTAINIYASSFANKDVIADAITKYNKGVDEAQKIQYTDYVGLMMSAVTTIINAITYVLIAFVAISLVVSSIMVGVITLISVQERTKEIGILRAIGASKRDVSSMFNAETIIIGFAAGLFGVLVTYLLCIPINLILHALTGIKALSAFLHPVAALILIAISVLLTLISGLIPSRSAAKKDPVVALRTE